MDLNSTKDTPRFDTRAIELIDKANEFDWTLKILSFALFVDTAICVTTQYNFWTFPWERLYWASVLGKATVLVLAYAVLSSILIPLLEGCIGYVVRLLYFEFIAPIFAGGTSDNRWKNRVRPYELLEHADNSQDDYALARYKEWESTSEKISTDTVNLGRNTFRILVFLLLNLYVAMSERPTTIFEIQISPNAFSVGYIAAITILFWLGCRSWCRDGDPIPWINYAPLYTQIEEKRRQEAKRR